MTIDINTRLARFEDLIPSKVPFVEGKLKGHQDRSNYFVESAINIANQLNIPEAIIGVSLVAFGTSLPELVVGILSAIRRKVDFALGNVLGSNIYNVLGVLGVSSFFGNFSIPRVIGSVDLFFMLFVTVMILGFMIFLKRIGRTYGSVGLLFYVGYIVYVFN